MITNFLKDLPSIEKYELTYSYNDFINQYSIIIQDEYIYELELLKNATTLFKASSKSRYSVERELCNLLRTFMLMIDNKTYDTEIQICNYILAMVSFDMEHEVFRILNTFLCNINVDAPILAETIIKLADYSLFVKHNYKQAKKWYKLSTEAVKDSKTIKENLSSCLPFIEDTMPTISSRFWSNETYRHFKILQENIYNYNLSQLQKYITSLNFIYEYISSNYSANDVSVDRHRYLAFYSILGTYLIRVLASCNDARSIGQANISKILINCNTEMPNADLYSITLSNKKGFTGSIIAFSKMIVYCKNIKMLLFDSGSIPLSSYYTNIDSLKYILSKDSDSFGKLSLMHVAYMNDPKEGKLFDTLLFKSNNNGLIRYSDVYIKCFTPQIDNLPMWKMYGDNATGCCIVIDWEKTKRLSNRNLELYKVCYFDKNENHVTFNEEYNDSINCKELQNFVDSIFEIYSKISVKDLKDIMCKRILDEIAFLFKEKSYAYEKEHRLLINERTSDDEYRVSDEFPPKYYHLSDFQIVIDKVILGPKCHCVPILVPYLQKSINDLYLEERIAKQSCIYLSKIDYV